MKNLILIFIILNFTINFAHSETKWRNDSRDMFQSRALNILEINPRTFSANDLNKNGIIEPELGESSGNFISAIERLDEIADLGINAIHIMPITPTGKLKALGTAGSLYALSDFLSLNETLDLENNNMDVLYEFEIFVSECHKRNIRVIVDLPSCGAYDLFLRNKELFYLNEKNEPISPADWLDVYLFKTKNSDNTLNEQLLDLHKKFINILIRTKVDGVRADVATIKPFEFWKEIILYARARNPQFLFIAEASNSWTTPPCKECPFTPYTELLKAGFDGYYGSYFNFKDWENVSSLEKQIKLDMSLSQKYKDRKSVIGSFSTHDELSPILIGGYNYALQTIWLNAVLPVNPYYVDGIQSGDAYTYSYANKKANRSYTDNNYYYVHKGKIDIFNFSRQPKGEYPQLKNEIALALKFRKYAQDVITRGKFKKLKTNNKKVFAFKRENGKKSILVILNKNKFNNENVIVKYNDLFKKDNFTIIKSHSEINMRKNKIEIKLEPSEIIILYSEK